MVMDCHQDQLQEIWHRINALHMNYLNMEEIPEKVAHRSKLEDCINNYLCHAPHNQKFLLPETAEVLYRSASDKRDFSGYKAALGFNAISMYAANLILQPWRKEYRQIKMYSGFYKHQIESNLLGAEILFEAMGYRHNGNGVLVLDGPICLDLVSNVSQDSLIAYVECQILKAIWEDVVAVYKVSWLEVLKFREAHLCSPKQSASALIYRHHQKQFNENCHSMEQTPPVCGSSSKFYYPTPPPPPPPYIYSAVPFCYPPNYMPHHYPHPMPVQYGAQHNYNTVPTGQLIELDHYEAAPNSHCGDVDKQMRAMYLSDDNRKTPSDHKNSDGNSEVNENWDYVYRNLESKGYYRDLLLEQQPEDSKSRRSRNKEKKRESYYDNVAAPEVVPKKKEKSKAAVSTSNGTVHREEGAGATPSASAAARKSREASAEPGWHCKTCTFLNKPDASICQMCNKSRKAPEVEEEMSVGGAQCLHCTFVNAKGKQVCDVCGCSLDNSPTYI